MVLLCAPLIIPIQRNESMLIVRRNSATAPRMIGVRIEQMRMFACNARASAVCCIDQQGRKDRAVVKEIMENTPMCSSDRLTSVCSESIFTVKQSAQP
ncbi:MAG: hypothetical protein WD114_00675 [Phycisphaerales bacterium]